MKPLNPRYFWELLDLDFNEIDSFLPDTFTGGSYLPAKHLTEAQNIANERCEVLQLVKNTEYRIVHIFTIQPTNK